MTFRTLAISIAALAAVTYAAATTQAHAQAGDLVRAGDAEMSCPAIASEMNTLAAGQAKSTERAAKGRKLLGFATTALQVAGPMFGGRGDGVGGAVVQQAASALQVQAMQQQMSAPAADTQASLPAQRLERLKALHAAKGC